MEKVREAPPGGNVPAPTSSFVGRQRELAEVKRLMETSRLLTLTGPGGVGKTRLAVQAGKLAHRAFRDGVWLVDLAALEEPDRLADAVAATLGVTDQSTRSAKEQLADHLADRSLLVVLDNCEHLLDACARLVDHLLHRAPDLRILATSRQSLGIEGERLLTVPPLSVPGPDAHLSTKRTTDYEAVALFVDRATALQPGFTVDDENREAVVRLCSRLDGLPLAIELAAGRLRALSVGEVADRLDDRFALLTRGSRAALSRQQTLRALIDWSADLCTEQERALWARLSVFPADFDLAAAEEICSGDGLEPAGLINILDGLVAKSIVNAQPRARRSRYWLLETIRHYGRELPAAGPDEQEMRRRHCRHYLRKAEESCASWPGPGQDSILARLREEHANFSAALDWTLSEPGETENALRLAAALRYHWILGGFLATGRRRLDQVLAADARPTRARGDALWVSAWIALLQGDRHAAAARLDECAAIATHLADRHLAGYVALLHGTLALFADDLREAVRDFDKGISIMERNDDIAAAMWGQFQLSVALSHLGEHARADSVCQQAISTAESRGETWARSEAMWARGFDRWLSGDQDGSAVSLVTTAIDITPNANQVSTVLGLELLAWIAASQGRFDDSARLLGSAEALWHALGTAMEAFGPVFERHSVDCRTAVLSALGPVSFENLLAQGRSRGAELHERAAEESTADVGNEVALTRREREVAELIGQGLTNKAIAKALVVSPRTVDGHLERLFAKLGVGNRSQVAVWVHQHLGGSRNR
jgi:predicted ATPase/DNA-binding CsgD family transcriptional regulator